MLPVHQVLGDRLCSERQPGYVSSGFNTQAHSHWDDGLVFPVGESLSLVDGGPIASPLLFCKSHTPNSGACFGDLEPVSPFSVSQFSPHRGHLSRPRDLG